MRIFVQKSMFFGERTFCGVTSSLSIPSYYVKAGKVARVLIHKKAGIKRLYDYLYHNSTIFLSRKHNKFLEKLNL